MSAAINTNLNTLSAQRQLGLSASSLGTAIQRLSSGLRINSAKDDAAGLAIAERFTAQIKGTDQAARNANDGISLAQTAEGAMASISNNLQRIRELAVQSANSTNSASDRAALQAEATQLASEIDRIATQTEFNGSQLLNGSFAGQAFQLGAQAGQTVTVASIPSMRSTLLGKFHGVAEQMPAIVYNAVTPDPFYLYVGPSNIEYDFGTVVTDATAIAAAINTGRVPGLTAYTTANVVAEAATQTSAGTTNGVGVLTLNGVNINLSFADGGGNADAQNRAAATAAINAKSVNTGVVASDTGTGVSLTAADGRNIDTNYAAGTALGSALSDFGLGAAGVATGRVNYIYRDPTNSPSGQLMFYGAGIGGYSVSTGVTFTFTGSAFNGTPLKSIDLSTVAGANLAIQSADEALTTVSSARADMGAVQSRFQTALTNLQTASENTSTARSRILDADFAQETSALSRAQILQQASTAMVAQANQVPQGILALLR